MLPLRKHGLRNPQPHLRRQVPSSNLYYPDLPVEMRRARFHSRPVRQPLRLQRKHFQASSAPVRMLLLVH